MPNRLDLTNQRFGRLVALHYSHTTNSGAAWVCKCDCGKEVVVRTSDLRSGNTISCGCYHSEKTGNVFRKHGGTGTRLYSIWKGMIKRCENQNEPCFKWYGGKGIKVCDEWRKSFQTFKDWAIENGYRDDLTIDRIESDKNYESSNCQWLPLADNVRRIYEK